MSAQRLRENVSGRRDALRCFVTIPRHGEVGANSCSRVLVELGLIAEDDERRKELAVPILRLIAELQAHAENELLQEFMLRDEGSSSD